MVDGDDGKLFPLWTKGEMVAPWMDSNVIEKTGSEKFVIFVSMSRWDGIKNKIQGLNYLCYTHYASIPDIL